jgi:multidrug efflux pump
MTWLGMVIKGDPNLSFNIYFQVAIVAVIGLSAKNAILIVEFAKELQEKGEDYLMQPYMLQKCVYVQLS